MLAYSDEAFEQIGKTVREALGIDDQIKLDPIDFLRRLKHAGYIKDYVRLPDISLPNKEAEFNPDDEKIYLRDSVYLSAQRGEPHFRFTVFHESSHAILRHRHVRNRSQGQRAKTERTVSSIRRDEDEANKLTATLMAPFHRAEFTTETTPEQIANRFGLSNKAAVRRHEELGKLYRQANNLRRPLPKGVADFLIEQRRRGYVVTSLPTDEISAFKPVQECYTGDPCPNPTCGQFTMVRNGTSTRCNTCGAVTGDG